MSRFLYINGQDIKKIILGVAVDEKISELEVIDVGPEKYLEALTAFLKDQHIFLKDLQKIFVVVGPGSATALRSILSIVNSIRFVRGVRIYPIEKEAFEQDNYTFSQCLAGKIEEVEHKKYFFPIYAYKPKITLSTKDELKR